MHVSQQVWNVILFVWATGHDFLYLGAYALITRLMHKKHKLSVDDRITRIERILAKYFKSKILPLKEDKP